MTETKKARATKWSLRWKHAGFPLTEAALRLRKHNVEIDIVEEAETLIKPGCHSYGAPQLLSLEEEEE